MSGTGCGPGSATCVTGLLRTGMAGARANSSARQGEGQGYPERIRNMAVQNEIFHKHERFFEALIFGKICVEGEEGLP